MVALDASGRVTMANARACTVLGRAADELRGADWFDVAFPADAREGERRSSRALAGSASGERAAECDVLSREGTRHRVAWRECALPGNDGGAAGSVWVGDALDALEAGAGAAPPADGEAPALGPGAVPGALLASLVDRVRIGVGIARLVDPADPDSLTLVYANAAADEHFGVPVQPLVGQTVSEIAPFAAASGRTRLYAEVALTGQRRDFGEVATLDGQGRQQWYAIEAYPLPDRCVALCFTRVTERHAAEEEARRNAGFLDSIVENLPDMIFVKDADELRFVRFNRAGEELLGYRREDLIGRNDHDFFPKEQADFFTRKDREVLTRGELLDIPEEPIHTRSRGLRFLHTKKIPIVDATGRPRYLLGISDDITERKRVEREMERQRQELARSNAELEQFAYIASHDLQEPLRKVQAFGDRLAAVSGDALGETGRGYLERMQNAARRMQDLVNDLLSYSRVTTHAQPFAPVDLSRVFAEVLSDLEARVEESHGRVEVSGELPTLAADGVQMRQLFQNLLGNALKFHRPGVPPRVTVRAAVLPGTEGGMGPTVEVRVRDEGIGFDPADLDRIFVPFQRLHTRAEYEGTGMGLALCRKIVERHGGTLSADTTPGAGSEFIVRLPAASPEEGA